ncbi:hypothetical protein QRT03_14260 [Actinomycetospora sp. Odt1-22]|uniref:Septum formation-related domain-containing protein n=1 Tax=Actinomycetospora termitidis TaxID=3053470 RepID=A0ABT7M945_9PSEU|nr:hypothetical protein [Actinomycetospora sp. Odt1-22]
MLVVFAAGALVGGWRPFSSQPDVYTFGPDGDLPAFTLFDGQCANGRVGAGASYTDASNAPCGDPHDVEVVGTATPLNSSREVSYPGAAALAEFGRSFCALVVASGQVAPSSGGVDKSALQVTAVVPGQAVFDEPNGTASGSSGGRLVSCLVSRTDGEKLTDRFSVI